MLFDKGVAGDVDVGEVAIAEAAGRAPAHQIVAAVLVVGQHHAFAAEDAAAAPAPSADDIALDHRALRVGQSIDTACRVEITVGDADVFPAEVQQPVPAAEAHLHPLPPAPVHFLGLHVPAEDVGANAGPMDQDVTGVVARLVTLQECAVVAAVESQVLDGEGVGRLQQHRQGLLGVRPEDIHQILPFAAEGDEAWDGECLAHLVAAPGKVDDATTCLFGGLERRLYRRAVIGDAITDGFVLAHVEDRLRPGERLLNRQLHRLAPAGAAAEAAVDKDSVIAELEVCRELHAQAVPVALCGERRRPGALERHQRLLPCIEILAK